MNTPVMRHWTSARPALWAALGLLVVAAAACTEEPSPSSTASSAKNATPSPFSIRSSRILEGPAQRVTPTVTSDASAAAETSEATDYDILTISTDGDPDSGGAPLTVNFTAEVTGGPPGLRYRWDFGDHSAAAHQLNVQHTYSNSGEYIATFTVTGPDVEESQEVSIDVAEEGFDLDIEADPDIGTAPLTVKFGAVLDEDLPGPFYFQWEFGDGGRDVSNPTNHTYRASGQYTVTLTVRNGEGQATTRDTEIQVDPREDAQ